MIDLVSHIFTLIRFSLELCGFSSLLLMPFILFVFVQVIRLFKMVFESLWLNGLR